MKQIILKELREQYRVALIGMLIFSALLASNFSGYSQALTNALWNSGYMTADAFQPLMRSDILVLSAFGCGILGTVLGWLQIRAEKHPDLWAFLVHRPIERSDIFKAKAIAGLFLYALAAGIPIIGFEIWCVLPGHVAAPFEWPMLLPLLTILLSGVGFYFGGLLTGIRKARWFATQGVGVACGIAAVMLVFACKDFWQALAIVTLTAAALGLAARGSYLTAGHFAGQSRASKFCLSLVSTVAMACVSAVILSILANLLSTRTEQAHTNYSIIKDGRIIKVTRKNFEEPVIEDLNGNPLVDPSTGKKITDRELSALYMESLHASVDLWKYDKADSRFEDSYWYRFTSPVRFFSPWQISNKQLWFLAADGRLISYHGVTRLPGTVLAPPGQTGGPGPDDSRFLLPFNYAFSSYYGRAENGILASARTVYRVDTDKGELKPLLSTSADDPFLATSETGRWTTGSEGQHCLLLSAKSIRLVSQTGRLSVNIPYSPSYQQYPVVDVSFLTASNRFVVRMTPDYQRNKASGGHLKTQITYITSPSTITETAPFPESPERNEVDFATLLLTPALPPVIPYWGERPQERPVQALRFVLAGALAAIAFRRARREGQPKTGSMIWGGFILALGLPAFLTYYAVQEFVARESCPKCKSSRRIDEDHCEQCEAPFTAPEPTGTEIFEALPVP